MSRHYLDEEKLEQNLGKQMLPVRTSVRPVNMHLKTKPFQGSYVCLQNMTRLFIRSKRRSTKESLDHHLNPNPRKLNG